MQVEAGLIVERGTDEKGETLYGFVHRTFQEYFAAADVEERYRQDEDPSIISQFLAEHLHDPHWREVIFLLFMENSKENQQLHNCGQSLRAIYAAIGASIPSLFNKTSSLLALA